MTSSQESRSIQTHWDFFRLNLLSHCSPFFLKKKDACLILYKILRGHMMSRLSEERAKHVLKYARLFFMQIRYPNWGSKESNIWHRHNSIVLKMPNSNSNSNSYKLHRKCKHPKHEHIPWHLAKAQSRQHTGMATDPWLH